NSAGAAAATIAAFGTVQSAVVGTAFPDPLVVQVVDAFGNPVEGVAVTFDAPDTGASAVFSADTVSTDTNGLASASATANSIVGSYEVTASVDGVTPAATFSLSNRLDDGTTIDGGGGDDQAANIGGEFACALSVTVADPQGTPQAGFAVDFTAPDTGASATLSNGIVSGPSVRATTDESGIAIVSATANDIPGDYLISAQLVGSPAAEVEFGLSNIEGLVFTSGFDTPCAAPPF
ncbi:MAG: Ig-like domain-containing protein, partial [Rhodanobacteraceae bacterium]